MAAAAAALQLNNNILSTCLLLLLGLLLLLAEGGGGLLAPAEGTDADGATTTAAARAVGSYQPVFCTGSGAAAKTRCTIGCSQLKVPVWYYYYDSGVPPDSYITYPEGCCASPYPTNTTSYCVCCYKGECPTGGSPPHCLQGSNCIQLLTAIDACTGS